LYFRLNAIEIHVSPLRKRKEDIPLLLDYFLYQVSRNEGGRKKHFSDEALRRLIHYSFPGNVRQLKNVVEGAYYSTPGNIIEAKYLPSQSLEENEFTISWDTASAVWQVYKRIRDGMGDFHKLVKTPFLKRQIGIAQVKQVLHLALSDSAGRYRTAFRLLRIPAQEYASTIQFLKRNECYLDFRKYRDGEKE